MEVWWGFCLNESCRRFFFFYFFIYIWFDHLLEKKPKMQFNFATKNIFFFFQQKLRFRIAVVGLV